MPIKTFRGLIADGAQDTILLHTNDGSIGYRIVKFNIFPWRPGAADLESTVLIWKVKQSEPVSTSTVDVDFSNQVLLGAAYIAEGAGPDQGPLLEKIVFDNEIFNQDIYITHTATTGSESINYYIELDQVKLDLNENTVATLKDIRNLS